MFKFCEIFKNTFFAEHLRTTDSGHAKVCLNYSIMATVLLDSTFRSIYLGLLCEKVVLKNLAKFTRKLLCQSFFFNKLQAVGLQLSIKKFQYRYFLVNLADFFERAFPNKRYRPYPNCHAKHHFDVCEWVGIQA